MKCPNCGNTIRRLQGKVEVDVWLGTNLKGDRQVEMICPEEDFKDIQDLHCPICGALASYHPVFQEFIDSL